MAFYIHCEHCQRRIRVPNNVAGQEIRCFACRERTIARPTRSRESESLLEQSVQDLVPGPIRRTYSWLERMLEHVAPPFRPLPLMYLAFALMLLPILLLSRSQNDFQRRLHDTVKTVQQENPGLRGNVDFDMLVKGYSNDRLPGAHLARHTSIHWMYAGIAWAGTLIFLLLIFDRGTATLLQLSTVAFFTATAGMAGLFFLQLLAMASFQTVGMMGWMLVIVYILRLFAVAYLFAFMPGVNFFASLFGFTVGVGICEEFFKALPIMAQARHMHKTSYQTICMWGLASGMGFGIAEGIFYSARFYNGLAPGGMYLIRFTSCVAIHSILTAASALIFFRDDRLITGRTWASWMIVCITALAPSAILHGLYDTLLKHGYAPGALAVAVVSFVWLAFQIELANTRAIRQAAADHEAAEAEVAAVLPAAMTGILKPVDDSLRMSKPSGGPEGEPADVEASGEAAGEEGVLEEGISKGEISKETTP